MNSIEKRSMLEDVKECINAAIQALDIAYDILPYDDESSATTELSRIRGEVSSYYKTIEYKQNEL